MSTKKKETKEQADTASAEPAAEEMVMPTSDALVESDENKPDVPEKDAVALSESSVEEKVARLEVMIGELGNELEARNMFIEELMNGAQVRVETKSDQLRREAELLDDPFDENHQSVAILGEIEPDSKFELGQVLSWKNPRIRNDIGWKGWVAMTWDDPYLGETPEERQEKLAKLVTVSASRHETSENMDNFIRRNDTILCRMSKKMFLARRRKLDIKTLLKFENTGNDEYGENPNRGLVIGPGLTHSSRYQGEVAPVDGMSRPGRQIVPKETG